MSVNPDLDKTFDCLEQADYAGLIKLELDITGYVLSTDYVIANYAFNLTSKLTGRGIVGKTLDSANDDYEFPLMSLVPRGTGWINVEKANWVAWSQIGSANFEVNKTNDAGYRPMSWDGYVYAILKLDKNAIVYGSNGVTMMYPVAQPAATFGFKDLMFQGIKCKTAVGGNEAVHYFISEEGNLWRMTVQEGLQKLGYKEFLSPMSNPVLMWDAQKSALYISDIDGGYIFHDNALGGYLTGVTGIMRVADTLYAVSPGLVIAPRMELVTDTIDMQRRGRKDIENVEVAIQSDGPIYVSLAYRYRKTDEFRYTRWVRTSPEGFTRLPLSAVEFRLRIKSDTYQTIKLDYINIQLKYSDNRFVRGARSTTV